MYYYLNSYNKNIYARVPPGGYLPGPEFISRISLFSYIKIMSKLYLSSKSHTIITVDDLLTISKSFNDAYNLSVNSGKTVAQYVVDNLQATYIILRAADIDTIFMYNIGRAGLKDKDLPFTYKTLSKVKDFPTHFIDIFRSKQEEYLTVYFEQGEHKELGLNDILPFNNQYKSPERSGSVGTVTTCVHDSSKRLFALKTCNITENNLPMLKREYNVLRSIPLHKHLVSLKASYQKDKKWCFVMEPWADMDLLNFFSKKNELKFWTDMVHDQAENATALLIRWMVCLSSALCELHINKIKHRDIKPANILLVKDKDLGYYPILTDFGLSNEFTTTSKSIANWGSEFYLSPEAFKSGELCGRSSDIFH